MKTTLMAAAVVAISLSAVAANAQPCEPPPPPQTHAAQPVYGGVQYGGVEYYGTVGYGNDNYGATPPPPVHHGGRYEWQSVQKWVDGRYEQVTMSPVCRTNHHGRTHCHGGGTRTQWVPGHYETVQEWVWVAATPGYRAPPPPRIAYNF